MLYIPTTWWNAFIQSIDTSAVTNVAVTPGAKPCNVIAGRKYIGGSDSECAIRLVLTLIFACRRGEKETCRRGLNVGCVADRIQILHTNGNIKVILQWIYDSRKIVIFILFRVHTKSWISNSRTFKNIFGGKTNLFKNISGASSAHFIYNTVLSTEPFRSVKQSRSQKLVL